MTGSWAAGTTFRLAARLAEGIINQDGGQGFLDTEKAPPADAEDGNQSSSPKLPQ